MISRRRIVVTGMGLVSPLAQGVELTWTRLLEGRSGVRALPFGLAPDVASQVGAFAPDHVEDPIGGFDPARLIDGKDRRKMDRFIQMALVAADEAIRQARWLDASPAQLERSGTVIGSGVGGFPAMMEASDITAHKGTGRLSPFTIPSFLINLAAGQISIRYGFRGPIGAPVAACAASVQAIGDAARLIKLGEADIVVAGGAESAFHRVSLGAFGASRALSSAFNAEPERASRPFDRARDGFVMGEGAGVLVIEALDHALARGVEPLVEIVGYGTTADAFHIVAPAEDGSGAARAMRIALEQAGLMPEQIGYLNAHATSTPAGDAAELMAIRSVFGSYRVPVSSTKSATGHLLGAAGALEAIVTALALRDGRMPPTLNLENPDEAAVGVDLIGPSGRTEVIDYAMTNGFGFGGVNASLILRRWS